MEQNNNLKQYKNRLLVSDLIIDVLTDKKTVLEALSSFPKDEEDINIKCAFDALMHREADEDYRKRVRDYALVQDEFLFDIATILKKNQNLPKNIIQKYVKFHETNLLSNDKGEFNLKSILKKIKRMINF